MNAKYNQSEQDYIESILMLSQSRTVVHRVDVAKKMNVSQAAVNKAIKILLEKAYVYVDGKHLYLTQMGEKYAEEIYQKHCLLRSFLEALGVEPAVAEEDACHMEHILSPQTIQAIKSFQSKKK